MNKFGELYGLLKRY